MVGSKGTKEPVCHISCEVFVYSGVGWVWSGSIQLRATQLVIRQRLILSGDVELNPGPSEILTDTHHRMFMMIHIIVLSRWSRNGGSTCVSGQYCIW